MQQDFEIKPQIKVKELTYNIPFCRIYQRRRRIKTFFEVPTAIVREVLENKWKKNEIRKNNITWSMSYTVHKACVRLVYSMRSKHKSRDYVMYAWRNIIYAGCSHCSKNPQCDPFSWYALRSKNYVWCNLVIFIVFLHLLFLQSHSIRHLRIIRFWTKQQQPSDKWYAIN